MRVLIAVAVALSLVAVLLLGSSTEAGVFDPWWADEVVDFQQGPNPCCPEADDPSAALGYPDFSFSPLGGFVALGEGGHLTVRFHMPIKDKAGADLAIHGDPSLEDSVFVEVSANGTNYVPIPGLFPEHLALIDIADAGLAAVRFVRIIDDNDGPPNGAEIDAVGRPVPVPEDPFIGLWSSTDFDGSHQKMTIRHHLGPYRLILLDDWASACPAGGPAIALGQGSLADGNAIEVDWWVLCLKGGSTLRVHRLYNYDEPADILREVLPEAEVIWHRLR